MVSGCVFRRGPFTGAARPATLRESRPRRIARFSAFRSTSRSRVAVEAEMPEARRSAIMHSTCSGPRFLSLTRPSSGIRTFLTTPAYRRYVDGQALRWHGQALAAARRNSDNLRRASACVAAYRTTLRRRPAPTTGNATDQPRFFS